MLRIFYTINTGIVYRCSLQVQSTDATYRYGLQVKSVGVVFPCREVVNIYYIWDKDSMLQNKIFPKYKYHFICENGCNHEFSLGTEIDRSELLFYTVIQMEKTRVKSSSIRIIGYDEAEQILEIDFVHGGTYRYFGVPKPIYDKLMKSESAYGSYHARFIKNRYRHEKIS